MDLDRSIISWGTVFSAKSYAEILNMLITNYRAIYGADIDLFVNTADGERIRVMAQYLYDFAKLANEVYYTLDENNAKGKLLDNLVFLSGNLIRKTASKTRISGVLNWSGDSIDYDHSTDVVILQDNLNILWRVVPQNTELTILNSGVQVNLTCLTEGDYLLEDPLVQITHNSSFVTNDSITLGSKIIIERGSEDETDAQLRARKKESYSYNSTSLIDSIRESVLGNIFSISDIKIYNSNFDISEGTDTTPGIDVDIYDGTTTIKTVRIPLHDIFVLVKPQSGVEINAGGSVSLALVEILRRKITLGISTFQGDIDSNYIDETISVDNDFPGYNEHIKYYIAQPYNPIITITLTGIGNAFNLSTVETRIKTAIYNLSRDYGINKDINIADLMKVVNEEGNLDVNNPTFTIDSIVVTGGNSVNNGYWFVDGEDDANIIVADSQEV